MYSGGNIVFGSVLPPSGNVGVASHGTGSFEINNGTKGNLTATAITANFIATNTCIATNGFTSYTNALTINSFTFPATTVNWTNPVHVAIEVHIDATAVTGTAIKKNGTQIYGGLSNDVSFGLRDGEYFSMTYSVGTPVGTWSVFP